ncbi:MAG: hypothetical protein HRT66_08280 [Flavobacteriaceae bacterium]|nr:hypothetical protein [Flavobacteriaceae bacterium]
MKVFKITQDGKELKYKRDGNAYFVELRKKQVVDEYNSITVQYGGKPKIAPKPPWDSGMVWKKEDLGKPFVSSIS